MLALNGRAPNSAEPWSSAHDRRAPNPTVRRTTVVRRNTSNFFIITSDKNTKTHIPYSHEQVQTHTNMQTQKLYKFEL